MSLDQPATGPPVEAPGRRGAAQVDNFRSSQIVAALPRAQGPFSQVEAARLLAIPTDNGHPPARRLTRRHRRHFSPQPTRRHFASVSSMTSGELAELEVVGGHGRLSSLVTLGAMSATRDDRPIKTALRPELLVSLWTGGFDASFIAIQSVDLVLFIQPRWVWR